MFICFAPLHVHPCPFDVRISQQNTCTAVNMHSGKNRKFSDFRLNNVIRLIFFSETV